MATNADLLAQVHFFERLDDLEREQLASCMELVQLGADHALFLAGEPGDCLYVVRRGQVEIFVRDTTGAKVVLKVLGPGGMFGELSLLDNGPRSASVVTVEPSELLRLDREDFERFLLNCPRALPALLLVIGERLRHADELLGNQALRNPNQVIEQKLSAVQRGAAWIADFSGSPAFLFLNLFIFAFWITWNLGFLSGLEPIDPFPFGLLTMAVSLEAIFLSIIVLLAQNLQASREKIRDDIEYEINLRAEQEISHLHSKVDLMHAEILSRLHRMEKSKLG